MKIDSTGRRRRRRWREGECALLWEDSMKSSSTCQSRELRKYLDCCSRRGTRFFINRPNTYGRILSLRLFKKPQQRPITVNWTDPCFRVIFPLYVQLFDFTMKQLLPLVRFGPRVSQQTDPLSLSTVSLRSFRYRSLRKNLFVIFWQKQIRCQRQNSKANE